MRGINFTIFILLITVAVLTVTVYFLSRRLRQDLFENLTEAHDAEAKYRIKYEEMLSKYYDERNKCYEYENKNKELMEIVDSIKNESGNTKTIVYNGMLYRVRDVTLWDKADTIPNIDINAILYPAFPKGE